MKLSSFEIAQASYAFVLSNRLECARILWLPLALMFLLAWLIAPRVSFFVQACVRGATESPLSGTSVMTLVLWLLLLFALFTVLACIMCAGLWRFMLRGVPVSTPFYLGFGIDELRLLALAGLKLLLLVAWALIAALVIGLIEIITKWISGAFSPLILVLVFFICIVVLAWLGTRLSLAGPSTIKAQHIEIGASWHATAHYVTRLQRVAALLVIPLILLILLLLVALLLLLAYWLNRSGIPVSDLARICALLLAKFRYLLPVLLVILYVVLLFLAALFIAARAIEYQDAASSGGI